MDVSPCALSGNHEPRIRPCAGALVSESVATPSTIQTGLWIQLDLQLAERVRGRLGERRLHESAHSRNVHTADVVSEPTMVARSERSGEAWREENPPLVVPTNGGQTLIPRTRRPPPCDPDVPYIVTCCQTLHYAMRCTPLRPVGEAAYIAASPRLSWFPPAEPRGRRRRPSQTGPRTERRKPVFVSIKTSIASDNQQYSTPRCPRGTQDARRLDALPPRSACWRIMRSPS